MVMTVMTMVTMVMMMVMTSFLYACHRFQHCHMQYKAHAWYRPLVCVYAWRCAYIRTGSMLHQGWSRCHWLAANQHTTTYTTHHTCATARPQNNSTLTRIKATPLPHIDHHHSPVAKPPLQHLAHNDVQRQQGQPQSKHRAQCPCLWGSNVAHQTAMPIANPAVHTSTIVPVHC